MKPTFYDQCSFPKITNIKVPVTVGQRTANAPECYIIHKYPNPFYFFPLGFSVCNESSIWPCLLVVCINYLVS